MLYFEPQQYSREATLQLLNSWGMQVTACATKGQLQQAVSREQHYDIGLIGRAVAINQVNEIIALVQQLRQPCQYVYLLVNTLSPHLREAMLKSGADAKSKTTRVLSDVGAIRTLCTCALACTSGAANKQIKTRTSSDSALFLLIIRQYRYYFTACLTARY